MTARCLDLRLAGATIYYTNFAPTRRVGPIGGQNMRMADGTTCIGLFIWPDTLCGGIGFAVTPAMHHHLADLWQSLENNFGSEVLRDGIYGSRKKIIGIMWHVFIYLIYCSLSFPRRVILGEAGFKVCMITYTRDI